MKGKKMLLNGNGKKKLGKGIGRLCVFLLAISMVVSCNNVMEPPTASGVGDGRAYISISAGETARTVFPQLDFQNLSFALTGSLAGGNSQSLGSWNTYSAMDSALISLEIGEWSFTLTASNASDVVLEKSITKNITSGTHVLDFGTLAFSSGSGSVSVTLILPLNHGVATASAALYEVSRNNLVTGTDQSLSLDSRADGRQAVTYTQSNVTGGNYFLKFEFTQALESDVTDVYQELVQVAPHLTSSATRELVALNSYYQVTLEADGGTFSPDTTPSSFSRYDEVQLPTPTKEGYIFGGWYDKGDFTKTPVKTLPKGTDRDHNLTARWVQEVFVSAGGNDSNFGVSSSPFKSLQAAVNAIDAANDGTSSYTIKVMDNVDDSSSSSYDTSNNSALINIAPTKALNITIKSSADNTQRTINAGRTSSNTGRVMYVGTNATVTIQNLVLTGGNIAESGGGVFVGGGNFIINGGEISNNISTISGGGVYVSDQATNQVEVTINGTKINQNSIVYTNNPSTNVIYGGAAFAVNSAQVVLTINGGSEIKDNTISVDKGGYTVRGVGLSLSSANATTTIENTTISNNVIEGSYTFTVYGGGIYLDYGTLNLNSGAVIDSHDLSDTNDTLGYSTVTASYGGGIHLEHGVLNMEGCTINGNQSKDSGAGIQFNAGTLNIGGSTYIYPDNDVQLASGTKITITSELKGTTPIATISPFNYSSGTQILSTSSASNVTLANEVDKFALVPSSDGKRYYVNSSGELTELTGVNSATVLAALQTQISQGDYDGTFVLADTNSLNTILQELANAANNASSCTIVLDLSLTNMTTFSPSFTHSDSTNPKIALSEIIFPDTLKTIDKLGVFQNVSGITVSFEDPDSQWEMTSDINPGENRTITGSEISSYFTGGQYTFTKISP